MGRKLRLPKAALFLSLAGIIISAYLSLQHYAPSSGSFCDFGEHFSCSIVNNSVYSEIFGVPVAFLGVFWFAVASFLSLLALRRNPKAPSLLLAWSILGASFTLYLLYAELALRAACPFCLAVKAIVLSTLIVSFLMVRLR